MRTRRFRTPLFLLAIALVLWAMVGVAWFLSPHLDLEQQVGDTSIRFSASRSLVALPNDCITLSWDVQNTLGVKINGTLLPTPSSQEYCVDGKTPPTITVILMDETEVTYTLDVQILTTTPLFWLLGLGGFGVLVASGLLALSQATGERDLFRIPLVQRVLKGAFWTGLTLAVSWAILDGILRWYFINNGNERQKIMYVYSLEDIRSRTSTLIHMPYVSYVPNPDYEGHNQLGYRGEEITREKPAGVFRIVALGGSTTYSTGTTAEEAYPALLQKFLREDYGYTNVQVINAGFLGYTSWEALTTFAFRVLELDPDMIIYYEGVNDLAVRERASTACYAGENPMLGLNPERGLFVERNAPMPQSTLYRILAVNFGWIPNPLALDSAFEPALVECAPDNADITLEKRLEMNPPTYFERNIRNLILLAKANDVQPMVSSWVYNTASNRPELWRSQIALQNDVLKTLSEQTDTPFYDLASTFPEDATFWELDGVHMVASGTTEQARQYAQWIAEGGFINGK